MVDSGGDGRLLLVGTTAGSVSLIDTRARRRAAKAEYADYTTRVMRARIAAAALAAGEGAAGWGGAGGDNGGVPVAGIAPMFSERRFVTSSFDGYARVWDMRVFRPVVELFSGGTRLTRCDVSHDCIVAGGMDGVVRMWDMRPERGGQVRGAGAGQ